MRINSRKFASLTAATMLFFAASPSLAAPGVEFDFARSAKLRDVTTAEQRIAEPSLRVVELRLPVSVRFRGVALDDVDEIDVEINCAGAVLRVASFAPTTQLTSELTEPVKTTTTTRQASSLDASLGGTLPIPYAELVAHLTPTINAGTSRSKSATESSSRRPPQRAIVVSGTSAEGRGVFFKLKRSSQTSLEGVHDLAVSLVVPDDWKGGLARVSCIACGQKKIMFVRQSAILGGETVEVKLRAPTRDEPAQVNGESKVRSEAKA